MLTPGECHVATSLLSEKMSRPAPLMIPRSYAPAAGTWYPSVAKTLIKQKYAHGDHTLDTQLFKYKRNDLPLDKTGY